MRLREGYASFLGGVPELVHNLRVWLMDSEYPLNLTLDSLQRMRPYKEFCSTHGQGLMERILTLRQCLRNLYGKLEPHHLADVRLVGEQITATANMLHPLLTGSTNNKEAVFWPVGPRKRGCRGSAPRRTADFRANPVSCLGMGCATWPNSQGSW